MKRLLLLVICLPLGILSLCAQTRQIKGRVLEEGSNVGLPNVSVVVAATNKGVSTDPNGNFSISVEGKNSVKLLITYVGYKSQTITTTGASPITVLLNKDEVSAGDEVVVVGYSSIRRRDLTGSVSSVDAKQIKDNPLSSAAEILQGRLAGVQVTSAEGAPGSDVIIRVRGGGSITQDNSPLYIVDGVQVENALTVIAPQDIAKIDVLKDASTTAIYGARAANGVVLITTKTGRPGKTQVSYTGSVGIRNIQKTLPVLSPYDFVRWQYERSRGSIQDSTSFVNTYGSTWDTLSVYKDLPAIDWQEKVFGRRANFQNHNVTISGGSALTTFNLSLTRNKEDGIMISSGFERSIVNLKVDHKISDKFKIGITTRYLQQTITGAGTSSSGFFRNNRLRNSVQYRPFEVSTPFGGADEFDELLYLNTNGLTNPVISTEAEYRKRTSDGIFFTGYLNYNIIKNLVFRSTVGYDNSGSIENLFNSKITYYARQNFSLPTASIRQQFNTTINNSNTLQYAVNKFKGKHDIGVLLGQEIVDRGGNNSFFETKFFPADITPDKALANMGLGAAPLGAVQPLPNTFVDPQSRIFSFFSRVTYAFKDKYLANFSLRSDRSSKFNADNGSLIFPSGSFAWRFTKEKFWKDNNLITDGKIRVGYGIVGNNRIGDLLYQQLFSTNGQYALNGLVNPGLSPTALSNPLLRWEQNKTTNIGIDLSLFKNKVQLTVDMYKNTANDLLLSAQIPATNGYASQIQNIGATSNKGIEFQIDATPIATNNFTWSSNFNLSFNRNTVLSLGGPLQFTRNSGWQGSDGVDDYLVRVGQPIGLMYGFVSDGIYKVDDFIYNPLTKIYTPKPGIVNNTNVGYANIQPGIQPGAMKWKDISGPNGVPDGIISADYDRVVLGNAQPDFIGGWNNQFRYKNFDFSIFVNFVVGNSIYNANKIELSHAPYGNTNLLNIMKNRWTNINDQGQRVTDPVELAALNANADIWTPNRDGFRYWLTSWAIEDGSYLRINNLTVGYTLPKKLLDKAKITSLRVFGTSNNLATFTKYTGYDPDVSSRRADPLTPGVDYSAYPRAITWIFGVNVIF